MLRYRHDRDLFDQPVPHPSFFRKDGRRRKFGYADRPGTGPKGQRCGNCRFSHCVLVDGQRSLKCEIMARYWSYTSLTDIQPRAPACSHWQRKPFQKLPS